MFPNKINTKIIATVGKPTQEISVNGGTRKDVFYNERLPRFSIGGVDIFRINMAFYHDEAEMNKISNEIIPVLKDITDKPIAMMGDLGPKIRIKGPDEPGILLSPSNEITLLFKEVRDPDIQNKVFSVVLYDESYPHLCDDIAKAFRTSNKIDISIGEDDVILSTERNFFSYDRGILKCVVTRSGKFKEKKGLTFRGVDVEFPKYLTDKVKNQIDFLLQYGGDLLAFVALSFVQDAKDILEVRAHIENYYLQNQIVDPVKLGYIDPLTGKPLPSQKVTQFCIPMIIAKIETKKAIDNIEDIVLAADGIMIARGDLGLQIGVEKVPAEQKRIIKMCNLLGKPVITATQMLKSMTAHPTPTRAEASDVFNAILDGSDAIMLSEETSEGVYPYQAIERAVEIATVAEAYYYKIGKPQNRYERILNESLSRAKETTESLSRLRQSATHPNHIEYWREELRKFEMQVITDRVTESACTLSDSPQVKAIIAPTTTGRTARMISRFRPAQTFLPGCPPEEVSIPIIGAVHDIYNWRKLVLSYGVRGVRLIKTEAPFKDSFEVARNSVSEAIENEYIDNYDRVVVISGWPLFEPGNTNIVTIQTARREVVRTAIASESSLKKDWLRPEEDEAWQSL